MQEKNAQKMMHACKVLLERTSSVREHLHQVTRTIRETNSKYLNEEPLQKQIDEAIEIIRGLPEWYEAHKNMEEDDENPRTNQPNGKDDSGN